MDSHDEKIFDDDNQSLYDDAQNILLSPNKRISAEVRWFCGEDRAVVKKIVEAIRFKRAFSGNVQKNLSKLNVLIYKMQFDDIIKLPENIIMLDMLFAQLDADDILRTINEERKKAAFPAIQNIEAIKKEITSLKDDIRIALREITKGISQRQYSILVNKLMKKVDLHKKIGSIIDGVIAEYRLDINEYVNELEKNIVEDLERIKKEQKNDCLESLRANTIQIADLLRPCYLFDESIGMGDESVANKIFFAIRSVAVDLYNDCNKDDIALRISQILQEGFGGYEKLINKIEKDIMYISNNRASDNYYAAMEAFDNIQNEIDSKCHFEEGFAKENMSFYENDFLRSYKKIITEFLQRSGYINDELQKLYSIAACLYGEVANALTWADEFKLAFSVIEAAYQYAQKSGDNKCIENIKKSYDSIKRNAEADELALYDYDSAMKILVDIAKNIDKDCWYKSGHATANRNFYNNVFKTKYQPAIEEILNKCKLMPDEWCNVYVGIAHIYRVMANALTWADEFELAYKEISVAYEYAKESKNRECLEAIRKVYNEIKESYNATKEEANSSSSYTSSTNNSSVQTSEENNGCGCGCVPIIFAFIIFCVTILRLLQFL
jgi:hypothetical protein